MRLPAFIKMKGNLKEILQNNLGGFHSRVFTYFEKGKQFTNVYIVTIPESSKRGYQQAISADAFCKKQMERYRKPPYPSYHYSMEGSPECFISNLERNQRVREATNKDMGKYIIKCSYEDCEVHVFETIWEFYNHIGWDYKKKQFKNG